MTKSEAKPANAAVNELFAKSPDGLREIVRAVMQEMLEAEMTDALGAEKGERTAARLGYRSGYYTRTLVTRVGKLELRVPQDRQGRFSTQLFERYAAGRKGAGGRPGGDVYSGRFDPEDQDHHRGTLRARVQRLSHQRAQREARSRKSRKLCPAGARSRDFPYLILDARYEKVREDGVIRSRAVLVAIGIDWEGRGTDPRGGDCRAGKHRELA